jgi:hypothetical protein
MADEPKLQIDSDWKKQAAAEKERLAAEVEKKSPQPATPEQAAAGRAGSAGRDGPSSAPASAAPGVAGPEGLPPPSFQEIIGIIGTQAFMFLGEIADPQTGQGMISPPLAKHYIDLLAVLESKTKGNLTADEKSQLDQLLYEARMRYVQIASGLSGIPETRPGEPK